MTEETRVDVQSDDAAPDTGPSEGRKVPDRQSSSRLRPHPWTPARLRAAWGRLEVVANAIVEQQALKMAVVKDAQHQTLVDALAEVKAAREAAE